MAVILDKIGLIDRRFPNSLLGYCRDDVDRLVAEERTAALCARFREVLLASLDLLDAEARKEGAEPEGGPAIGKDGGSALVAIEPEGCLAGGGAA